MTRISTSLVLYKSSLVELQPLFTSLQQSELICAWVVVDNAAAEDAESAGRLRALVESMGGRVIAPGTNVGFGAGHNLALRSLDDVPSDFHLMLNPDILFDSEVLPALAHAMKDRPQAGLVTPRVLYPDGTDQYLCKLLPTPLDFALRRFAPGALQRLARSRMERYELRGLVTTESTCVPFMSGCFMFTRRSMLEAVGGFDDRFFLYLEDVDLCRRLAAFSELLYWPEVSITHGYHRGAHRNTKLMLLFILSAVRYFNKWGWLFDAARRKANSDALALLSNTRLSTVSAPIAGSKARR